MDFSWLLLTLAVGGGVLLAPGGGRRGRASDQPATDRSRHAPRRCQSRTMSGRGEGPSPGDELVIYFDAATRHVVAGRATLIERLPIGDWSPCCGTVHVDELGERYLLEYWRVRFPDGLEAVRMIRVDRPDARRAA